jgi:hypothetical protein
VPSVRSVSRNPQILLSVGQMTDHSFVCTFHQHYATLVPSGHLHRPPRTAPTCISCRWPPPSTAPCPTAAGWPSFDLLWQPCLHALVQSRPRVAFTRRMDPNCCHLVGRHQLPVFVLWASLQAVRKYLPPSLDTAMASSPGPPERPIAKQPPTHSSRMLP